MKETTRKVWEFIKAHTEEKSYPPTTREIGAAIGVYSTNTVIYHVEKLAQLGLVERRGQGRRMVVCGAKTIILTPPLVSDEGGNKKNNPIPNPSPQAGKGDKTPQPAKKVDKPPKPKRLPPRVYQVPKREYPFNAPP